MPLEAEGLGHSHIFTNSQLASRNYGRKWDDNYNSNNY